MGFTNEEVINVGNKLNIDWNKIDINQFKRGLEVELEHGAKDPQTNITNDDLIETAKIALVHLKELPDYYTRLDKMENTKENKTIEEQDQLEQPEFEENKDSDGEQITEIKNEKCCPKIKGGGLISLLEHIIPLVFDMQNNLDSSKDDNPFEVLENDDFDSDDSVVKEFKDKMGGVKGVIKIIKVKSPDMSENFASVLTDLYAIRKSERLNHLRQIFSEIHNVKRGVKIARSQVEASKKLSKLMSDCNDSEEFRNLKIAKKHILTGNVEEADVAAYRIREVFSSYVPQSNVRLAYTSLVTQDDEPFLLCPKARYQIGVAKPMEISKCRDNCIDSRTTVDGKTVCAYAEWLKVADSQNALNDRLEVYRNPDNEENLLTLNKDERSKKIKYDDRTWEQRLEEDSKRPEIPELSLEKRLDKATEVELGHHGEPEKSIQQVFEKTASKADKIDAEKEESIEEQIDDARDEEQLGDETIEAMLADEQCGLTEKELDMVMEEWLQKYRDDLE
jgi:hypothetical protein